MGLRMDLVRGACPGARKLLTYGARKQPHVRFPLPGDVTEAQRRTIRKLAEALGVEPDELVDANKRSLVGTSLCS